ncbi:hypothetical protein BSLG_004368 [Batrachochytrium salamandrivorans]|nr:hypothetical protein BSLG_004368 [Batrachochytrium salamandrivorans]
MRSRLLFDQLASPPVVHSLSAEPLKNMGVLNRFNPYAQTLRRREILNQEAHKAGKAVTKKHTKVVNKAFINGLLEQ